MKNQSGLIILFELIWWFFMAIIAAGVLYPIYREVESYPFWISNLVFIFTFLYVCRYIFFIRFSFLSENTFSKIAIIFIAVPGTFLLINALNDFQTYLDETGLEPMLAGLSFHRQEELRSYIRSEMMFFGTASVLSAIILPFRLIVDIWRRRNRPDPIQ